MTEKESNKLKIGDVVKYPNTKRMQRFAGRTFKICQVNCFGVKAHPTKKNGEFAKSRMYLPGFENAKLLN